MKYAYLRVKEVSERLQVTPRTLQLWRAKGLGPPYIQLGVQVRYLSDDFDAWFDSCRGPKR